MVSLYLLPVVVAATLLSSILTWLVAALTVLCYTVIFVYVPLPENHALHGGGLSLHLIGMWFTFLLSAALIAHFTARMARSLRARDAMLAAAREDALRSEQIVALGTMAAGAAHELGTPLNTMTLLADELIDACCHDVQARQCVTELKTQIANCKQSITTLLAAAQHSRSEGGHAQPADEFLEDIFAKWQIIRPVAAVAYHWQGARPGPSILAEQTLGQAVINLLNNAAGLSPHVQDRAGEPFFTTKPPGQGIGLGLFLANATIEKMGGSIELFSRSGGGTCTQVILPALTGN